MTKTELVYTNFIKTTPQKLWDAITNPEFCKQYWGGMVNVSDWKKGSTWNHEDTSENNKIAITGKVLECDAPKLLVISWYSTANKDDVSEVKFEIQPIQDIVRLDVTHSGLLAGSNMESGVSKGWPIVLSSMKSYLESGKGFDLMAILGDSACNKKNAAA